jgi:uridine kinase
MPSSVYIIAVAGPSSAEKTELTKVLAEDLSASVLVLDSCYRDLSKLAPSARSNSGTSPNG